MYQRRLVGLLLSGVAVALILASVLTKTWWGLADEDRSVSLGLRSAEVCEKVERKSARDYDDSYDADRPSSSSRRRTRTDCQDQGLRGYLEDEQDRADDRARYDDDAPEAAAIPGAFIKLGAVGFAFGLLAVLAIGVGAGLVLSPRAPKYRATGTVVALTCAAFAGVTLAFLVSAPSELGGGLRAGPGAILALLGAGAGLAGALILQRLDPATEPSPRVLVEATRIAPVGRGPVLIAGSIGCALIVASLFTHTWFHGEHGDASMGIGLRAVESCDRTPSLDDDRRGREKCVEATIPARFEGADQPTKMKVFLTSGNLAWSLGLAAIAVALACGGLALLRQPVGGRFAGWRIQLASAGAFAVAAIVYTASRPAEVSDVGISFGPVLAVGGAGCLVGGAIMLGRWITAMEQAIAQVPKELAQEPSAPIMLPTYPLGAAYAPPPVSPFVAPTMAMPSPFAPPGAMPASPFAPPTAPSPFAPPYAQAAPVMPPSPYAPPPPPAPIVMPAPAPVPMPVAMPMAAPAAPSFGMQLAPMPAIPACPQCHTPLLWVTAKGTWMCTVCRGRS